MKLFIESASLEAVEDAADIGACDGVIVGAEASRQGPKGLKKLVEALIALEVGPIVVAVSSGEAEAMITTARALGGLGEEVVAALPLDRDGLSAAAVCFDEGIATAVGPCANAAQALLAAKAGATWVVCDLARVEVHGADGLKLAEDLVSMLSAGDFETQLLVTGARNAHHVGELALFGAHAAALTPERLWGLLGAADVARATPRPAPRSTKRR